MCIVCVFARAHACLCACFLSAAHLTICMYVLMCIACVRVFARARMRARVRVSCRQMVALANDGFVFEFFGRIPGVASYRKLIAFYSL